MYLQKNKKQKQKKKTKKTKQNTKKQNKTKPTTTTTTTTTTKTENKTKQKLNTTIRVHYIIYVNFSKKKIANFYYLNLPKRIIKSKKSLPVLLSLQVIDVDYNETKQIIRMISTYVHFTCFFLHFDTFYFEKKSFD